MPKPQSSVRWLAALAAMALLGALALLKLWMATAPFSWSSERWAEYVPQVIATATVGYAAVVILLVVFWDRQKK